jgi:hypothetical protein
MPRFYFKTKDNDGTLPGDAAFEYPTLRAAIEQAKRVLAEMALDGIPDDNGRQLTVELEDGNHEPVVSVSLVLKVDYKAPH